MIVVIHVFCLICISTAMPLAKSLVDMSYVFDETIMRMSVAKGFKAVVTWNGTHDLFGGNWLQLEEYSSSVHVGTHMDAPAHTAKGGITVDQLPLKSFIAPAAVVDITPKAETVLDAEATTEDLLQWESTTGQSLNGTIILLRTGWGHKWSNKTAYVGNSEDDVSNMHFPGMGGEACQWLVDHRDIVGIGAETLSIDTGAATTTIPCHLSILGHGLFILENVANMDQLPIYGATLYVFPMKIGKGSGAPTRIVATIPKLIYNSS